MKWDPRMDGRGEFTEEEIEVPPSLQHDPQLARLTLPADVGPPLMGCVVVLFSSLLVVALGVALVIALLR